MKKAIVFALLLVFGVVADAASDRYLLEQNLGTIAQNTVDAMYGEGNFIVRVQVNMTESKYSVKYTQQSNPKQGKQAKNDESVFILPGVPALKNIAPGNLNQLPYDSVTTLTEPRIKNLLVYVVANKNYPRAQAKKVEGTLKNILGFKASRGDRIKTEFKPFYEDPNKETQNITIIPGEEKLVTVQNAFYLLFMLVLIIAVIVYYISQARLLRKESGGAGGPAINVNPNLELPEEFGKGGDSGSGKLEMMANIKRYFDFVTDSNIDDLIFLVQNQKLKTEYVSLIASFLPSHLSAKLIQSFPVKLQSELVSGIVDQRLGNRALLEKLDKKLKSDLECFVGGEMKLSAVVDLINVSDRKSILTLLKKNSPVNYKKVRGFIMIFDDILLLSERETQLLLSELNLEQLAIALVSVDQQVFDYIMENLTSGARDMVNQYLEHKSENATAKQIEKAQESILKVIKRLEKNGKIDMKSKLSKA